MSNQNLKVNYLNSHRSDVKVCLSQGEILGTTYKSNLRVTSAGGREILCIQQGSDNCIVEADMQRTLKVALYHGRSDRAADMEDWGTSYEGPAITADLIHIKDGGYHLISADGEKVILYVDDMLHHDGVYYGDVSVVVV